MKFCDKKLGWRSDIDGLRGIAILLVLAFHIFPEYVPGGFIGVDVFFVISGFLITKILIESLINDDFSIINFYSRRIRRIFPALLVVIGTCLIVGWFVLLPMEYYQLSKHVIASATFLSNFLQWRESGYFDSLSLFKPLLHLWSLAIEEQFYFVWPIILLIIYKNKNVLLLTLILLIISFLVGLYYIFNTPISAFYLPWSRAWEILFGALMYLKIGNFSQRKDMNFRSEYFCNFASLLGLSILVFSVFYLDEESLFPGYLALLPCIGSMLIITSGSSSFGNKFIQNPLFVFFGLISYPLYLWHWPVISYLSILDGGVISYQKRGFVFIISIFLAYLTYRLLESQVRKKGNLFPAYILLTIMILILTFGAIIFHEKGLSDRLVSKVNYDPFQEVSVITNNPTKCNLEGGRFKLLSKFCTLYLSDKSQKTVLLYGDSSSAAWSPVFAHISKVNNLNLFVISHPKCIPLLKYKNTIGKDENDDINSSFYCSSGLIQEQAISFIRSISPNIIFLIGAWNYSENECKVNNDNNDYIGSSLSNTIKELSSISNLVVFETWPMLPKQPIYPIDRFISLQKNYSLVSVDKEVFLKKSFCMNSKIKSNAALNVKFFDPSEKLCASGKCLSKYEQTNMYVDRYHITPQGSMRYLNEMEELIER